MNGDLQAITPKASRCSFCGAPMLQLPWSRSLPVCDGPTCQARHRQPRLGLYLHRCGVPARHTNPQDVDWSLQTVVPSTWAPHMAAWTGEPGSPWCVTLAGVVNAGKTTAAIALLVQAARRLVWPDGRLFARAAELTNDIIKDRNREAYHRATKAPILVLDDLGRYDRIWDICAEILSSRHANLLPTIITTNMRVRTQDQNVGIADVDPALFRRLSDGIFVGMTQEYRP